MQNLSFRLALAKDSFINTKSRKMSTRNVLSIIACIIGAIIVALLITLIIGYNPLTIFTDLFSKGFIDYKTLIWNIALLGIGGLSFSFAFRAGTFNIGIPGQMMMSGLMVLVISKAITNAGVTLPTGLGPIISILIALVVGALVATITALLKLLLNVNDVVSAILLNWIIFFIVRLVVYKYYNPNPNAIFSQSENIPTQFQLIDANVGGWLPTLIILIILAVGIFLVFKYTTFGHKVIAVGANVDASTYAGYNVKMIKVSTMAISGAIAGILAVVLYTAGQTPAIPLSFDNDTLPAQGLNGIAIGLIALNSPIGILPVAFIMGLFISSSSFLQISPSFSQLIIGLIIFGAAMFVIFFNYHPWLWLKKVCYGMGVIDKYKIYENNMETLISKYRLKLSETNDPQEIAILKKQYNLDKKKIIIEYRKEVFIFKATNAFTPLVEAKNVYEVKNKQLEQQFIRYSNRKNKKLRKLSQRVDNHFNHLLTAYKTSLKKFNSFLPKVSFNKTLQDMLLQGYAKGQQTIRLSHVLFTKLEKNITQDNNLTTKLNEYQKVIQYQMNESLIEFCLALLKHNIAIDDLRYLVHKHFFFLSFVERIKIIFRYYSNYKHKVDNHQIIEFTKKVSNIKLDFKFNNAKLAQYDTKFITKYKLATTKLMVFRNELDQKIIETNKDIEKSKTQINKWMEHNITKTNKYYQWRAKLYGSKQEKLKKFNSKLIKLGLDEDETNKLKKWLEHSYEENQH